MFKPKKIILCIILLFFTSSVLKSQGFGQNKVQYRDFDWHFLQTEKPVPGNAGPGFFGKVPLQWKWLLRIMGNWLQPELILIRSPGSFPGID